jgi:hypothetical protein
MAKMRPFWTPCKRPVTRDKFCTSERSFMPRYEISYPGNKMPMKQFPIYLGIKFNTRVSRRETDLFTGDTRLLNDASIAYLDPVTTL